MKDNDNGVLQTRVPVDNDDHLYARSAEEP